MENKKSIVVYADWLHTFEELTDDEAGKLIKHFFRYVNDLNPEPPDRITKLLFQPIKRHTDYQNRNKKSGHWNWKGGISPLNRLIRNSSLMKQWRKDVFERDNYTCKNCKSKNTKLNAHHIKHFSKFPDLRFDIENGITLCVSCHKKEHSKTPKNGY